MELAPLRRGARRGRGQLDREPAPGDRDENTRRAGGMLLGAGGAPGGAVQCSTSSTPALKAPRFQKVQPDESKIAFNLSLVSELAPVEVYVGSVGRGVQWDVVNKE